MYILRNKDTTPEQLQEELDKVIKLNTKRLLSYYRKHRYNYMTDGSNGFKCYTNLKSDHIRNFYDSIREELCRREHIEH